MSNAGHFQQLISSAKIIVSDGSHFARDFLWLKAPKYDASRSLETVCKQPNMFDGPSFNAPLARGPLVLQRIANNFTFAYLFKYKPINQTWSFGVQL